MQQAGNHDYFLGAHPTLWWSVCTAHCQQPLENLTMHLTKHVHFSWHSLNHDHDSNCLFLSVNPKDWLIIWRIWWRLWWMVSIEQQKMQAHILRSALSSKRMSWKILCLFDWQESQPVISALRLLHPCPTSAPPRFFPLCPNLDCIWNLRLFLKTFSSESKEKQLGIFFNN